MYENIMLPLQDYYADRFPQKSSLKIRSLEKFKSGWESELFLFILESGPPGNRIAEQLVLRLYSGEGSWEKAALEYQSLMRLHEVGYPVPRVEALELGHSLFGKPFIIMEKISGEDMWSLMQAATANGDPEPMFLFCQLLVRLHALDWRLFVEDPPNVRFEDPYKYIDEWFGTARNSLVQFPVPGFQPVVDWLYARRESFYCRRPSPVHNDFHPGNVLLPEGGAPVVIDWTGFRVSDARFDLAWTLMLIDAYLGADCRARMLREYEQQHGEKVAALAGFEVCACAGRLFGAFVSLLQGAEKMGMRSEAVEAMQKAREPYQRVYVRLLDLTGIRIPEVEQLLASLV